MSNEGHRGRRDDDEQRARRRLELVFVGQAVALVLIVLSCVWIGFLHLAGPLTSPWSLADFGSLGDAVVPLTALATLLALGLGYWGLIYQREDIDEQLREVTASRKAQEELATKQAELIEAEQATAKAVARQADVMREQLEELREFNSKILAANLELAQQQARAAAALTRAAELQERAAATQERERLLAGRERELLDLEALRNEANDLQGRIEAALPRWRTRIVSASDLEYSWQRSAGVSVGQSPGLRRASDDVTQLREYAPQLAMAVATISCWILDLSNEEPDEQLFERSEVHALRRRILVIQDRVAQLEDSLSRFNSTGSWDPPVPQAPREQF